MVADETTFEEEKDVIAAMGSVIRINDDDARAPAAIRQV